MKRSHPWARCVFLAGVIAAGAAADSSAQEKPPPLIERMVGTWAVRASVWFGADATPIVQSAAATRRLIGNGLLEEVMTAVSGSGPPFVRVAFLNYNAVTGNYEYMSWDTRAPQMMYQVSHAVGILGAGEAERVIWFRLVDNFVAPQWGNARNVAFKQRLMFEPGDDRQVVRLYWTRLSGEPNKEFLAGEYVYTRERAAR